MPNVITNSYNRYLYQANQISKSSTAMWGTSFFYLLWVTKTESPQSVKTGGFSLTYYGYWCTHTQIEIKVFPNQSHWLRKKTGKSMEEMKLTTGKTMSDPLRMTLSLSHTAKTASLANRLSPPVGRWPIRWLGKPWTNTNGTTMVSEFPHFCYYRCYNLVKSHWLQSLTMTIVIKSMSALFI